MARHRLNAQASIQPATRVLMEGAPRTAHSGQHRAAKTSSAPAAATTGAFVALAGAIGLSVAGAAQAAAAPAATPVNLEAIAQLPGVPELPADVVLPTDVALPAEIGDFINDLIPPGFLGSVGGTAVKPTSGTVSSHYGARWGTTHHGVDIAAPIGTPVHAVTDGTVLESGPASGFGQWIRVQQDDGTIGVFGHVDQSFVTAGQQVRAGEQIGTVGNRGQSTGPHLHYEVWQSDGTKVDPEAWLNNRGITL